MSPFPYPPNRPPALRGIPREFPTALLHAPHDRYEFEAAMLRSTKGLGMAFEEVPIRTIYLRGAASRSHFSPILDSMRVYRTLFQPRLRRR